MRSIELLSAVGITCEFDCDIKGVTADSREVHFGFLFVAIKGENTDGHEHIREAKANGALIIISERQITGGEYIVESSRRAYSMLLNEFFGRPADSMRLLGITGTNGKSTTAMMLYRILSASGRKAAVIGTFGCYAAGKDISDIRLLSSFKTMTTPDPEVLFPLLAYLKESRVTDVVMEISSHSLVLEKVFPLNFEFGIYTNFSSDHLDFHKTKDEYKRAKLLLADKCKNIIYSNDCTEWAEEFGDRAGAISFSLKEGDCVCRDIKATVEGSSFVFSSKSFAYRIDLPIIGEYNIENAMAALTAAKLSFVSMLTAKDALASFSGIEGRCEKLSFPDINCPFSVIIDYAHTEEAMKDLLKEMSKIKGKGRIITLFGCGGNRDKEKRPKMGRTAEELSDILFITADNSRNEETADIINDILLGIKNKDRVHIYLSRKEAIENAVLEAREDDILLLVGKGHEKYDIGKEGIIPFNEKDIVKGAVNVRFGNREVKGKRK